MSSGRQGKLNERTCTYSSVDETRLNLELLEMMVSLNPKHVDALGWFAAHAAETVGWPLSLQNGQLLATQAKGIYKPAGWSYALSVKVIQSGRYPDEAVQTASNGRWSFRYHQEEPENARPDTYFTNRALQQNMVDGIPIGVIWQISPKPNPRYEVIGVGVVTKWQDGFFTIEGPALVEAPTRLTSAAPVSRLRVRDITQNLSWLDQVYGSNLEDAPVLSFPRGNRTSASVVLTLLKELNWRSDFIVQYVPLSSETERYSHLKGKLISLVAFYDFDGDIADYINPNGNYELDMSRWPDVAPLREAYRFVEPPSFSEAVDPNWRTLVQTSRGRLGRLNETAFEALKDLEVVPVLNMYRSPKLMETLALREAMIEKHGGSSFIDITMSRSTERAGWVYAIALPAYPGHVKIGHCLNIDCRRAQLSTSVPEDFAVLRAMFFPDRAEAERALHSALSNLRVRQDREWFTIGLDDLEAAFQSTGRQLGGRG